MTKIQMKLSEPGKAPVFEKCIENNNIGLSFFDSPSLYTGEILDVLEANNAKGTFYLTGNRFESSLYSIDKNLLKRMINGGHSIGL